MCFSGFKSPNECAGEICERQVPAIRRNRRCIHGIFGRIGGDTALQKHARFGARTQRPAPQGKSDGQGRDRECGHDQGWFALPGHSGPTAGGLKVRTQFRRLGISLQPLQIRLQLVRTLIAQASVFLQSLLDDLFQLRRYVRIQPHR